MVLVYVIKIPFAKRNSKPKHWKQLQRWLVNMKVFATVILTTQSTDHMHMLTAYCCVAPEINTVFQHSKILFHLWAKAFYNF